MPYLRRSGAKPDLPRAAGRCCAWLRQGIKGSHEFQNSFHVRHHPEHGIRYGRDAPGAPRRGPSGLSRAAFLPTAPRSWTALLHFLVVAAVTVLSWGCASGSNEPPPVIGPIIGQVMDMDGLAISGAAVYTWEPSSETWTESAHTNANGEFETEEGPGNRWIRVTADQYHPRTRAASPEYPLLVRLSEDDGQTIRLQFAGDTMFGRRFYDPDEDGDTSDAIIRPAMEVIDIPEVISGVLPLLGDAHFSSINLETPLTLGGTAHPSKDYSYFSSPYSATALADAGIDFVNLANNHVYDYLEQGIQDTLASLDFQGLPHQGAGTDEDGAWSPTLVDVNGTTVAFIGCTTITGSQHEIDYVADDQIPKGGAAACDSDLLYSAITTARELSDIVIVQLHGGEEYSFTPGVALEDLSHEAILEGADLVLNHHPHVFQGLELFDNRLVAWSLGNFIFDGNLWDTFPTALLEVHLGLDGSLKRAFLEPLLLEDYEPRGIVGWYRIRTARDILGLSELTAALDDGALELDLGSRSYTEQRSLTVSNEGTTSWSFPQDLRDGWLESVQSDASWRLGRDLLLVGDFEDHDIDDDVAEGILWDLDSSYEQVTDQAAHSGYYGLRLRRDYASSEPVFSNPAHRLTFFTTDDSTAVESDSSSDLAQVTVSGWLNTKGDIEIRLSWYSDTEGSADSSSSFQFHGNGEWTRFQVDTQAPDSTCIAVGLYILLYPPDRGEVTADLDDLRVIQWSGGTPDALARYDQLQVEDQAVVSLIRRVMPGGF